MSDAVGLFPQLAQPLADVLIRRRERAEMADVVSPFPAPERPVAEAIVGPQAAVPLQRDRNRAVWGVWLLMAGIYGTHEFMVRDELGIAELVTVLIRQPQSTASALGAPIVWCAMALFGGLCVAAGIRNARAPHNELGVVWLFCFIGGCTYALVGGAYLDDAPVVSWYLRGLYLATFAASVMELYLFTRCTADDLVGLEERQARPWPTGRSRQF